MAGGTHTVFRGINHLGEKSLSEIVSENLCLWVDWAFLNLGGFQNISLSGQGIYSTDKSRLRLVDDKRYNLGQCWEGFRSNWIWESGVATTVQPTRPSGVYVNSVFYASNTTGAFAHIIDYPRGRVVFNTAIPTGSIVQDEFSYKYVNVTPADSSPWFKRVHQNSERADDSQFLSTNSGVWYPLADTRAQMPHIAIDVTSYDSSKPLEIGSGARWKQNKVGFYIFADSDSMCDRLGDIIQDQDMRTIYLFDSNMIASGNFYPLTPSGTIANGAKTYPQLVDDKINGGYFLQKLYLKDARTTDTQQIYKDLHMKVVTFQTEVPKYI